VTCAWCFGPIPRAARADARFCGGRCRVAAHRSSKRYDSKKKIAERRGRVPASDARRHKALQLRQYEAVLAAGGGTDWTRAKVEALKLELT
jgi:hypothetical protein